MLCASSSVLECEENRLSLELQRGLAGLGEARNSGGCINCMKITSALRTSEALAPSAGRPPGASSAASSGQGLSEKSGFGRVVEGISYCTSRDRISSHFVAFDS